MYMYNWVQCTILLDKSKRREEDFDHLYMVLRKLRESFEKNNLKLRFKFSLDFSYVYNLFKFVN